MGVKLITIGEMLGALHYLGPDIRRVIDEQAFGELCFDGVAAGLQNGFCHLWIYYAENKILAWAVTRVADYMSLRRLVVDLAGGERSDVWLDEGLAALNSWGRQNGCKELEARARPGLAKLLAKRGFVNAYNVILKEIDRGVH